MAILNSSYLSFFGIFLSLLLLQPVNSLHVKILPVPPPPSPKLLLSFPEAPAFRNGQECKSRPGDKDKIHIVMPLDMNYIRGTVAAVLSILQHSMCPENVAFHFLSHHQEVEISYLMRSTFPYLTFKLYHFDSRRVHGKISKSVRKALDQPLNYARIYLSNLLPVHVKRVIYLDSDIVVVDDIAKLWGVEMDGKVLAAPEYCHANFTSYFTQEFWTDTILAATFKDKRRRPCYFNTGVMVVDVEKWRNGRYTERVEGWMEIQKQRRIYHLGSLPPILLVFAGDIMAVDHRWNQHGLGGDNLQGNCRGLHPGPISLLHWSGKGKPWLRLDAGRPCTVDYLWAPYDLHFSPRAALE